MKKRAVFTSLFLLVYGLWGAYCTPADNSTCATPSENDFNDTSNNCSKSIVSSGVVSYTIIPLFCLTELLFDLKDGPLVVHPNQPLCICAVGSKPCVDGTAVINNVHAYGSSVISNTRTPHKQLLKTCLVRDKVTSRDNGSLIFIRLVGPEGSISNPHTATTELVVLGK